MSTDTLLVVKDKVARRSFSEGGSDEVYQRIR
jgi:hypothetical protein